MQNRAIETKNKLITVGLEVIAEYGYYNVTMDEIAKRCNLSTGGAYRYFKNKKDLFIAIIKYYYENISNFANLNDYSDFKTFEDYLRDVFDKFLLVHRNYYGIHEELEGLCHIDKEIKNIKEEILANAIYRIAEKANEVVNVTHLREKVVISIGLMENAIHSIIEFPEEVNADVIKNETIRMISSLFGGAL